MNQSKGPSQMQSLSTASSLSRWQAPVWSVDDGPGGRVDDRQVQRMTEATLPPPPTSRNGCSVLGQLLSLLLSGSCCVLQVIILLARSLLNLDARSDHLLYMILELISLLLIRTSSSRSFAFICLYSV